MFQDGKLYGQDFEALRQGCIDNGELFTDPEFPPDDQSLYFSQETPFAFEWKRASEITDGACLFEGGATRFDINQGELGDCWLLAALANLTLNKRLLYQGKLACTVKLGDKERFDKVQIGIKEPFPVTNCQFTS